MHVLIVTNNIVDDPLLERIYACLQVVSTSVQSCGRCNVSTAKMFREDHIYIYIYIATSALLLLALVTNGSRAYQV